MRQITTSLGHPTELAASETLRIHFTRTGKMILMPYPASVAGTRYPHGLKTHGYDDASFAELNLINQFAVNRVLAPAFAIEIAA